MAETNITVKFIRKSTQDQFNFSHASALKLLSEAGLDEKARLGYKRGIVLKATTAKGTEVVVGDTHAIWKSHQTSDAIKALFGTVEKGQAFALTFTSVEVLAVGGEQAEEVEVDL